MNASNSDRLSRNFTLGEFTQSSVAETNGITIKVETGGAVYANLQRLCQQILQPLRDALGPVRITSGYRPAELNRIIGGAIGSQHQYGLAADLQVDGYTPQQVAEWIRDHINGYDQLIHEFGGWVHVSVAPGNKEPRRSCLTAVKDDGHTVYVSGIHSVEDAARKVA